MVNKSSQLDQDKNNAHKPVPVTSDPSNWLWRVGTAAIALGAGLSVAASRIWELHYNEIKKTKGFFNDLREGLNEDKSVKRKLSEVYPHKKIPTVLEGGFHPARDGLWKNIHCEENASLNPTEKFKKFLAYRKELNGAYRQLIEEEFARIGIPSKGIWGIIEGTWKRFQVIGSNNQAQAMIGGFVTTVAAVGIGLFLRENNRLWGRLDKSRAKEAQDIAEIERLNARLAHNPQIAIATPNVAASDVGANDNMPSAKISTDGLQRDVHAVVPPTAALHA